MSASPQKNEARATPAQLNVLKLLPIDFDSNGQIPVEVRGLREAIRECRDAHWLQYRFSSWTYERGRAIGLELTDAGRVVLARGGSS